MAVTERDMDTTVAIVGTGLIGRSWSAVFARAGAGVRVWDPDEAVRAGFARAFAGLCEGLARERLVEDADGVAARVAVAATLEAAVTGADLVQENTPEDIGVKREVFAALDAAAAPGTILASSTSAIVPSLFTEGLEGRARCLVAHPVNPPHLVPVVELCPAPWTDPGVLDRAEALYERVGQSPVRLTREIEGFVLNRLQGALLAEAMRLIADGTVSPEGLDRTIRDGLGLRWALMGPIETIDLNAPGGIEDYCRRYGPFYARLAADPAGPAVFAPETGAAVAEAWPQDRSPDGVHARQDRRDRRLAALRRHLRDAAD